MVPCYLSDFGLWSKTSRVCPCWFFSPQLSSWSALSPTLIIISSAPLLAAVCYCAFLYLSLTANMMSILALVWSKYSPLMDWFLTMTRLTIGQDLPIKRAVTGDQQLYWIFCWNEPGWVKVSLFRQLHLFLITFVTLKTCIWFFERVIDSHMSH